MTCIIGMIDENNDTWMAGDSMGYSNASNGGPRKAPKVFKVKDKPIVIGFTSSFRMGQLLEFHPELFPDLHRDNKEYDREYLITKVIPKLLKLYKDSGWEMKRGKGDNSGGTFLIGVPGHIFVVQDDFAVLEAMVGFEACGCGANAAEASIDTSIRNGKTDTSYMLKTAMQVVVQFAPGVQPPFNYITTNGESGVL